MSEAHQSIRLDLDDAKYGNGLKRMETETRAATARAAGEFSKIDKSASQVGYRFGQVSMQAQDIAVQLQNGTSAAMVLAQQGSQIASIFGPTGAILGGVLAIGAGIYSWVSGMKESNEEAKRLMASLGELQSAAIAKRDKAMADRKSVGGLMMSGRTAIEESRLAEKDERAKMQADFENIPAHKRDWALHSASVKAMEERYAAQRDKIYTEQAEEFEKKEAARAEKGIKDEEKRVSDLRSFEKQQYDEFQDYREGKQREFARLQEAEVRRVTDFQKKETEKNEKLTSLQSDLRKEEKKAEIEKSAVMGQRILDDIKNHKDGISSADIRKAGIREINEESRAINRQLAKENFGNLSGEARRKAMEARRADIRADINAAKNKDKLKAEIDGDSITKLTAAIEKLLTK